MVEPRPPEHELPKPVDERLAPDPALFPEDEAERREVDELVAFLDAVAGTSVRAYSYWLVIQRPGGLYERWARGLSLRQRLMLRPLMPVMNRVLPRVFGLTADRAPRHLARVWESCERVEARIDSADDYLVGGRFTAADLTAASLLGPAAGPAGSPWETLHEGDRGFREFLAAFAERPAAA